MGNILTKDEVAVVEPHMSGFDPGALANVIWDAIREINQDNKDEGLGIYFGEDEPVKVAGGQQTNTGCMVTYWDDEGGVNQLPRKVFLEIMYYIGGYTINKVATAGIISVKQEKGLFRLKLSMEHLSAKIDTLYNEQGSAEYYQSLERDEPSSKRCSVAESDEILDKLRAKNVFYSFMNSMDDDDDVFSADEEPSTNVQPTPKQKSLSLDDDDTSDHVPLSPGFGYGKRPSIRSKGIEAVVNRLPELRSRYEKNMMNSEQQQQQQQGGGGGVSIDGGIKRKMFGKLKMFTQMNNDSGSMDDDSMSIESRPGKSLGKQSSADKARGRSTSSTDESFEEPFVMVITKNTDRTDN